MMAISDEARKEGFEIFKKGLVRRLSPTHFVAKAQSDQAWQLIELKKGHWTCDCNTTGSCTHLYAALLQRSSSKLQSDIIDESNIKCRYCSSPDLRRCGFRYNSHGISRRYYCHDCQRKFSVPYVKNQSASLPAESVWLLDQVGMLISKLTDCLEELISKIDSPSIIIGGKT